MSKTGLQALLTPKDSVLLLTDHQPFVMNTEGEIHQAIEDYQQGRMGAINS
jgi:redox-sensitive bicupin YhaK (pirin superfamily)